MRKPRNEVCPRQAFEGILEALQVFLIPTCLQTPWFLKRKSITQTLNFQVASLSWLNASDCGDTMEHNRAFRGKQIWVCAFGQLSELYCLGETQVAEQSLGHRLRYLYKHTHTLLRADKNHLEEHMRPSLGDDWRVPFYSRQFGIACLFLLRTTYNHSPPQSIKLAK